MLEESLNEATQFVLDKKQVLARCKQNADKILDDTGLKSTCYCIHYPKGNGHPEAFWFYCVNVRRYFDKAFFWYPEFDGDYNKEFEYGGGQIPTSKRYPSLNGGEGADKGCTIPINQITDVPRLWYWWERGYTITSDPKYWS